MRAYINERLEIHRAVTPSPSIIYGTTGSPFAEWETEIIENDGGYRHAFQNREQAIGKWDVGSFTYNLEEWEYLMNFFIDKRGSAIAFRYKDWSDFEAVNQAIGVGDGENHIFLFKKTYGDYQKYITQLVNGTVSIFIDGVLQTSGFTIYYDYGVVTFSSAVADGAIITADFEFDNRVRFETDTLPATFMAFSPSDGEKLVDVGNMPIIETLTVTTNSNNSNSISDYLLSLDFLSPYQHARIVRSGGGNCATEGSPPSTDSTPFVIDSVPEYTSVRQTGSALSCSGFTLYIYKIYDSTGALVNTTTGYYSFCEFIDAGRY